MCSVRQRVSEALRRGPCPSQFDSEAVDEGLVGEEEEGGPVDLLVTEHGSVVLAVDRALEKLDNLCDSPGTHVNWG